MFSMPHFTAVLLLIAAIGLSGCSMPAGSNISGADSSRLGSSQEKVNEGFDELQALVNISVEPDELLWTEEAVDDDAAAKSGRKPGSRRLLAVIRFEAGSSPFEGLFAGKGEAASVEVEDWFPAELVAQGQAGGGSVKGAATEASAFYRAPFSNGRLVRVEGSSFYILELFAD